MWVKYSTDLTAQGRKTRPQNPAVWCLWRSRFPSVELQVSPAVCRKNSQQNCSLYCNEHLLSHHYRPQRLWGSVRNPLLVSPSGEDGGATPCCNSWWTEVQVASSCSETQVGPLARIAGLSSKIPQRKAIRLSAVKGVVSHSWSHTDLLLAGVEWRPEAENSSSGLIQLTESRPPPNYISHNTLLHFF